MTHDEYMDLAEGRRSITETCVDATNVIRSQIEQSSYLREDRARLERFAMALGALLAYVDEDVKAELMSLVRHGGVEGATVPGSVEGVSPGTEVVPETIERP